MGVEPRRVRRRRAPVARLDALGEEHSVAPRLASGLRRSSARLRQRWRRPAGPRSQRIQRGRSRRILPICPRRPRTEMPLRRAVGDGRRCPPAPSGAVGEAPLPSGDSGTPSVRVRLGRSFGCEGNVPSTHHCSAKGPVVRLNATTKNGAGRGPRDGPPRRPRTVFLQLVVLTETPRPPLQGGLGHASAHTTTGAGPGPHRESPRESPRAAAPSTGRRPHGRSRPGGALRAGRRRGGRVS